MDTNNLSTEKKEAKKRMNLTDHKKRNKKIALISAAVAAAALICIYLGISFYFQDKFYFGTEINGIKVSGKTVEEVEKMMAEDVSNYILKLERRGDEADEIHASEIDLTFVSDGAVAKLLEEQNAFAWPAAVFSSEAADLQATVVYDEAKLQQVFAALPCLQEENTVYPVSAYPEYDEEAGEYVIVDEVYGAQVIEDKLYGLLGPAILNNQASVSLDEEACYVDPELTAEADVIVTAAETLNKYVATTVTYEFGDVTEVLDGSITHAWFTISEDWEIGIDATLVREFVDYIGSTYNTIGKSREFTTSHGNVITVSGGDYGWWMDRETETEELVQVIREGQSGLREPVYNRKAASYSAPDYGNTYVEISIQEQRMWFYKDGVLLVDTPVVTGDTKRLYQGKSRETPTGLYGITYVDENAVLNGEDYSSPVDFWMPFWYDVGIHDAKWRKDSEFGGTTYQGGGSHGCVNTPHAAAKTIHDNIAKGDPVIVY